MVNRFILYDLNKKLKYCPYCKQYVDFLLEDRKYYMEITCKICKNMWIEGVKIVQKG